MGGGHFEDLISCQSVNSDDVKPPYEIPQEWVRVDIKTARLLRDICCVGYCTHCQFGWMDDCYYDAADRGLDPKSEWWEKANGYVGLRYYLFLQLFISWCKRKNIDLERESEYASDKFFEKYCVFVSRQRLSIALQTRMFKSGWSPISLQGNFLPLPPNVGMPAARYN